MPTELILGTTADGAAGTTDNMTIKASGDIHMGLTATTEIDK